VKKLYNVRTYTVFYKKWHFVFGINFTKCSLMLAAIEQMLKQH